MRATSINGLCLACLPDGACRYREAKLIDLDRIKGPYLQDTRNFGRWWMNARGISAEEFPHRLMDEVGRHPGKLIDPRTGEEFDDWEILVRPREIPADRWDEYHSLDCAVPGDKTPEWKTWFRDNYGRPCGARPRADYIERHQAVISSLALLHPVESARWGRRPANDVWPPARTRPECPLD